MHRRPASSGLDVSPECRVRGLSCVQERQRHDRDAQADAFIDKTESQRIGYAERPLVERVEAGPTDNHGLSRG